MVQMEGKYTHIRSENVDEFFKAAGVNYVLRKTMAALSPTIEIKKSENGEWTISLITAIRTSSNTFKLGEPYEQSVPGKVIKCVTTLQDGKLITECVDPDGTKTTRTYEFTDEGLIMMSSKILENAQRLPFPANLHSVWPPLTADRPSKMDL